MLSHLDDLPTIKDLPGPKGKWFIGDALAFDAGPVKWMVEKQREYGDLVKMDSETITIHHPDLIHYVLDNTNKQFLLDNAVTSGSQGRQTLLDSLNGWMDSRKYLSKGLHHGILKAHIDRAKVNLIQTMADNANKPQDLFDVSQRLLGYAVADFCIGADPEFEQTFDLVEEVFWASLKVTDSGENRLPWLPRPIAKKAMELNNQLVAQLTSMVRRRRQSPRPEEPRDALDHLIDNLTEAPEQQIVAATRLMMVTAHGPSGAIFSWLLLQLASQPQWIEKIREELTRHPISIQLRDHFPIALACIKETMRMNPANWLMGRTAGEDTELAGYLIPQDCRILFSPYVVHRDSRFWSDPNQFLPQRWLEQKTPYTNNAYFPFGGGPRICPGALLGPVQLFLGLATLLNRYDLDLPAIESVEPTHSTLMIPHQVTGSWHPRVG